MNLILSLRHHFRYNYQEKKIEHAHRNINVAKFIFFFCSHFTQQQTATTIFFFGSHLTPTSIKPTASSWWPSIDHQHRRRMIVEDEEEKKRKNKKLLLGTLFVIQCFFVVVVCCRLLLRSILLFLFEKKLFLFFLIIIFFPFKTVKTKKKSKFRKLHSFVLCERIFFFSQNFLIPSPVGFFLKNILAKSLQKILAEF